jgi:Putative peptidoglycan binding domain
MNATFNVCEKGEKMKQNKSVLSALTLTGLLGLSVTPGWSQMKPGESPGPTSPGSSQKEQGTSPGGSRSGQMKSSNSGKGTETGDQTSAKGGSGQWGKDDIKKVQEALKDKGQDPGPADGVIGAQTQKALSAFQSANGLKATGRLDAKTAKALGVERGSSSMGKGSSSMEKGTSSKEPSNAPMGKESSSKSR